MYGLNEDTIARIQSVFQHYPQVEKAVLYGSRAKGSFKQGSDIDLTLQGGESLSLNILYRILDDIDDLLLPYSFDISILPHISDPDVLDHIERVGVTFYDRNESN